ncbi:sensor histidine kinase [Planotetraspora sp. A-T 1434]|uniref:sensor histidine kinase n=1 Tax=Planotetraspora sp. A-T 1434 TaxID=2979219 RepID=UPI0021C0D4B2|nr:sensor histidine kinase [Planotetraspora sp. A-T 1434]MCT9933244.1 sensor histidine kinase [Planotetraspora sp. A-T 1434]
MDPTPARPRPRIAEFRVEPLLAAAMGIITLAGTATELAYAPDPFPPAPWAYGMGLVASAALVARRRAPVAVSLVGLTMTFLYNLVGYPGLAAAMPLFAAYYAVAAYGRSAWSLLTGLCLVLVTTAIPALPPHPMPWTSFPVLGPGFALAWMVVLGAAARSRATAAEERLRHATEAAKAQVARRLAEERLRVARELHDVLAHTISTIAVHSGLALDALDGDPEQARAAMRTVRAAAKEARPQLRAALSLLRGEPGVAPQPGLGQIPDLTAQARAAGLRVELTMPPALPISPLLQLTAYRIVQEALTNVVQHAGAREVSVTLRSDGRTLTVDVADDGRGPDPGVGAVPDVSPGGPRLGLAGMRERAAMVGGRLTAQAGRDGGFHVHAELPLGDLPLDDLPLETT